MIGALSFEQRCIAVPMYLKQRGGARDGILLLEIHDPPDAYPDYSAEAVRRIKENSDVLRAAGVVYERRACALLAPEDDLLEFYDQWKDLADSDVRILDITSMPKRYFCFLLKRSLLDTDVSNLIVTYTEANPDGYASGHLAEDPMTCDHLPGFAAPPPPKGSTLVVAVGFEALSLQSILDVYRDQRRPIKLLLPFPPGVTSIRRHWDTVRRLASDQTGPITQDNLEVVATWDAEQVYLRLRTWHDDSDGLTMAPFGPKPHSLGMALFSINYDCGMYYTQPKSYNPDYSKGAGHTFAYLTKWRGIACYDRSSGDR